MFKVECEETKLITRCKVIDTKDNLEKIHFTIRRNSKKGEMISFNIESKPKNIFASD